MRCTHPPASARAVTSRGLAALVVGALAAGGLGGCVAGSHTTTSTLGASTVTPGATATASLPTGGASLAGKTQDPNAQPVPTGEGVPGDELAQRLRDLVAAKGSVRLSMTTAAGPATAQVDTRTKAMQVQVTSGGRTVTLVHLGDATWVKGAGTVEVALPPKQPGGKARTDVRHWLRLDPGGADQVSRRLGSQADVARTLDPARFTGMLQGLLGDKTPRGDGSQVAFSVPPTQYLDAVGAPPGLRSSVTRPARLVVALDGEGTPTSVTVTVPTEKGELVDRTEYSRWGQPVSVDAPPEDDVAPAPGSPAPTSSATGSATAAATATATATVTVTATPTR